MKPMDTSENKDGRIDLILDQNPKEGKTNKPKLPEMKELGKNEDGYDILPKK